MTQLNNYDEEFGLIGQTPRLAPSAFDDFWATITDMAHVTGEDEERHEFYRQIEFTLRFDSPIGDVADTPERFNMPTDRKTGGSLVDETGKPVLPSETGKWGRFYAVLDTLGVPWEHKPSRLLGLHAHFQRKGTRVTREDIAAGKRAARGELPYGRYVVEWDGYDNAFRQSRGLSSITETAAATTPPASNPASDIAPGVVHVGTVQEAPVLTASSEDPLEVQAAILAAGKDFFKVLGAIRTSHKHLAPYANKGALDKLVDDGLLAKETVDGKEVYKLGPALA